MTRKHSPLVKCCRTLAVALGAYSYIPVAEGFTPQHYGLDGVSRSFGTKRINRKLYQPESAIPQYAFSKKRVQQDVDALTTSSSKSTGGDSIMDYGGRNPFTWKPLNAQADSSTAEATSSRRRSSITTENTEFDFISSIQTNDGASQPMLLAGAAALLLATGVGISTATGISPTEAIANAQSFIQHPQESMQSVLDSVQAMGPAGLVYFGVIYCIAEILAVPATPLTLSAGYLFGVGQGTAVVLVAATIAASVAFVIGKTLLRSWVETLLKDQPKFAKLDKAIGEEGFKLLFLVRLSPIFPFALSNYLYGASSIDFASYFWGTLLGFAPGTLAYVYTGMVGKALTLGVDGSQPWYVYAGGLAVFAGFLKLVTDVAGNIVEAVDDDNEEKAGSTTSL